MKSLDRILALLALTAFIVFIGIVAVKVARLDLTIVVAITVALVVYDCWTQLFPRRG